MTTISEAEVEAVALAWLSGLGWSSDAQGLFIFRVGLNRSRHSRESGNPYHIGLWQLSRGKTM